MKNKILNILIENTDGYVTGENLAQSLGISRQSVWKHVTALKNSGYQIESEHRLGYRLKLDGNLDKASVAILARLSPLFETGIFLDSVDSTNRYAKLESKNYQGLLVVADEQQAGRGRLGRVWQSPKGEGLWFSLMLKPDLPSHAAAMLTQIAALAMHRAMLEVTALSTQIKWPNDILYEGKKLCGILTEMTSEISALESVIIGIGVNVNQLAFPEELADIATSLGLVMNKDISRLAILSSFLAHFEPLYQKFLVQQNLAFVETALNAVSSVVGQEIWIIEKDKKTPAKAKFINQKGELIAEVGGDERALYYGEISIRTR